MSCLLRHAVALGALCLARCGPIYARGSCSQVLPRDGLHVVEVGSGDLRGHSRNPRVRTSPSTSHFAAVYWVGGSLDVLFDLPLREANEIPKISVLVSPAVGFVCPACWICEEKTCEKKTHEKTRSLQSCAGFACFTLFVFLRPLQKRFVLHVPLHLLRLQCCVSSFFKVCKEMQVHLCAHVCLCK